MKNIYLILNSRAGSGSVKRNIGLLLGYFEKYEAEVSYNFTERAGHAAELAQKAALQNYDIVVAVGGDGTVNEVARGLAGSRTAMGIIPVGSGNGLARDLKISTNIKKAVENCIKGTNHNVDLWQMNDEVFACSAGLGFDAAVAHKMALSAKRGRAEYIRLTIKEAAITKPIKVNLQIGNKEIEKSVFLVSFANASQYGNNAYISPGAKTNDGLLDIILIKPISKILYPVLGISLFLGIIHKLSFFERYRANSVIIKSASTNLFHFDGESIEMKYPVKISLLEKKLKIRTPE
jgi:YegS/Rv2252/BmrU family lipid kinase